VEAERQKLDQAAYTMATSASLNHEHHIYTNDEDFPFEPDGKDAWIGDKVERRTAYV